ncbi:MAG: metallopeptidase family protein [Lachnospiraceae bacterium]|nr:metallopeptidase family protein [Lachnospiraceae bacterium]
MVTFEEFEDMLIELAEAVPEKYYVELNGGVMAREDARLHPQSRDNDLFIMGEYHRQYGLGRYVVLYYGSFMAVYGGAGQKFLQKKMRETLLHELTHHLESLAGEKDLEIEDAIQMAHYARKNASSQEE